MDDSKQVRENLYTSLLELGLSEAEIDLYVVSLIEGPSPINKLAKRLQVSRPTIYKVISELETRGLAKFSTRKKYARDFCVEPPTIVLEKLRKLRAKFHELDHQLVTSMPSLLALFKQGDQPSRVKIFNGKEQFIELFKQILEEEGKVIDWCGSESDWVESISWLEEIKWIQKRIKKRIKTRLLLFPSAEAQRFTKDAHKELREIRFLKDVQPFSTFFQLYANKVILWQPKAHLAILLEDEHLVKMFRSIFQTLWEKSSDIA